MSVAQVDRYESSTATSTVTNDMVAKNIKLICKRNIDFDAKNGLCKVARVENNQNVEKTKNQQQSNDSTDDTQTEEWHPTQGTRYIKTHLDDIHMNAARKERYYCVKE